MDFLMDFDGSKSAQDQQLACETSQGAWSVADGPTGSLRDQDSVPVWEEEVDSDPGN